MAARLQDANSILVIDLAFALLFDAQMKLSENAYRRKVSPQSVLDLLNFLIDHKSGKISISIGEQKKKQNSRPCFEK